MHSEYSGRRVRSPLVDLTARHKKSALVIRPPHLTRLTVTWVWQPDVSRETQTRAWLYTDFISRFHTYRDWTIELLQHCSGQFERHLGWGVSNMIDLFISASSSRSSWLCLVLDGEARPVSLKRPTQNQTWILDMVLSPYTALSCLQIAISLSFCACRNVTLACCSTECCPSVSSQWVWSEYSDLFVCTSARSITHHCSII